MIGLLSLPNELLIQILSLSPATRTRCDLARVNKRMRAIWLQHSEQVITDVYNSMMPYFQDAVDFTLAQARQATTITIDIASPEAQPLCHHLPQILRNIDLAIITCDQLTRPFESSPKYRPWLHQANPSLHAAYFLVRRVVLAYALPGTRSGLHPELRSLSLEGVETARNVICRIFDNAPRNWKRDLGCYRTEEIENIPVEDRNARPPLCWRQAELILRLVSEEKQKGVVGKMEVAWTKPPVEKEDLDLYSSYLSMGSESGSDVHLLGDTDSDEE